MSQLKGGANEGVETEDKAPPSCYTPPTLSTHKPVIGTGNHKASLGDSRLSNMHLQMQSRGRKLFPK